MKRALLVITLPLLHACVFVEPKATVALDARCDTAIPWYTIGIDDTPGEGLVVLEDGFGSNIPAMIGSCGGNECVRVLQALGRQLVVETIASATFALASNAYHLAEKQSHCASQPVALVVDETAPDASREIPIESLDYLLSISPN